MANSEPVYIRDCEKCGEPRIATAHLLQMKEGESDWTDVKQLSVRCSCGLGSANDRDLAELRLISLETAVSGVRSGKVLSVG
jgi:hypothetical protein